MTTQRDRKDDRDQLEIDAARARAQAYKEQVQGEEASRAASAPKAPRSEAEWNDVVSQAIEEAMRKGEFTNLRGRGKPLPHKDHAFTPAGSELAYDILKNNDLTPGWIGDRKQIEQEVARWRAQLGADATRIAADWDAASSPAAQAVVRSRCEVQRGRLRTALDLLNRRIRDLNLKQPVSSLHLFTLRLGEEERRAGIPEALLA